tara:strand:+ start:980 stop:1534 length:555 start_codon:yes stop_codon:yes gene_type:complete
MADQVFTAGQVLTSSNMTTLQNNIGLIPMGSFTNSAATTLTAGSCFTSAYTNYRLVFILTAGGAVGSPDITCQFNVGATPTTTNYANIITFSSNTAGPSRSYAAAGANFVIGSAGSSGGAFTCDVFYPQQNSPTVYVSNYVGIGGTSSYAASSSGSQTTNNQHTGLTLTCASTFTGTLKVYGYR